MDNILKSLSESLNQFIEILRYGSPVFYILIFLSGVSLIIIFMKLFFFLFIDKMNGKKLNKKLLENLSYGEKEKSIKYTKKRKNSTYSIMTRILEDTNFEDENKFLYEKLDTYVEERKCKLKKYLEILTNIKVISIPLGILGGVILLLPIAFTFAKDGEITKQLIGKIISNALLCIIVGLALYLVINIFNVLFKNIINSIEKKARKRNYEAIEIINSYDKEKYESESNLSTDQEEKNESLNDNEENILDEEEKSMEENIGNNVIENEDEVSSVKPSVVLPTTDSNVEKTEEVKEDIEEKEVEVKKENEYIFSEDMSFLEKILLSIKNDYKNFEAYFENYKNSEKFKDHKILSNIEVGEYFYKNSLFDKSKSFLEKSLNVNDYNLKTMLLHKIGFMSFSNEEYEKAIKYFSKIEKNIKGTDMKDTSILLIAHILKMRDEKEKAVELYQKYIEIYPNSKFKKDVLEELTAHFANPND